MTVEVRSATLDDLPDLAQVALATNQPTEGTGADPRYATHLLTRGRLVVAVGDSRVVGYAAAISVLGIQQLTDLFVLPEVHGEGIGGQLLDAVWGEGGARATFSSGHPHALPLYVRAGLRPLWPLVYVTGDPVALPLPSRSLIVEDVAPEVAAEAESVLGGGDRRSDYALWSVRPQARTFVVSDGRRTVAAGATGADEPNVEVSHLRVVESTYATDALLGVVGQLTDRATVAIPGPNDALPVFIASGWQVSDIDHFMATSDDLVDPNVLFPHPGLL